MGLPTRAQPATPTTNTMPPTPRRHPAFRLTEAVPIEACLGLWMADPMTADEATQLAAAAEEAHRQSLRANGSTLRPELARCLARLWLEAHASTSCFEFIVAFSETERALLKLVHGQALMGQRRFPAIELLDQGFSMAATRMDAADYLAVMNRHQALRAIPLAEQAKPITPLRTLLQESRVIRSLESADAPPRNKRRPPGDRSDTVG